VFRRPVVAVLALGDELVGPTEPLGPGSIPVSNLYVIAELSRRYGGDVRNLGIAPDNSQRILELLQPCCNTGPARESGAWSCDLVITLGGTHQGDFDFVHSVLEGLGAQLEFDRVAMTPGASTVFATRGPLLIFGLPGTPAASWVAFESLVRPALLSMAGRSRWLPHRVRARVSEPLKAGKGRTSFIPCRLEWQGDEWHAYPIHGRHPREAPASLRADGLIRLDDHNPESIPGSWVTVDWIAD
jgi:molybdopterin molybdotransferase